MLRTMILPLKNKNILLPNTAVAEVVPLSKLTLLKSSDDEFVKKVLWRKLELQVINIEQIEYPEKHINLEIYNKVAILNVVVPSEFKFIGVLIVDFPRLSKIGKTDLKLLESNLEGCLHHKVFLPDASESYILNLVDFQSKMFEYISSI